MDGAQCVGEEEGTPTSWWKYS